MLNFLNSVFNTEMRRKLHERQTSRSDIWDTIFTPKAVPSAFREIPLLPLHSEEDNYPSLRDAIIITTPFKLSSSPCPCTPNNRKKWTARERVKAQKAIVASDVSSFQELVKWKSLIFIFLLIDMVLSSSIGHMQLESEVTVILLIFQVLCHLGKSLWATWIKAKLIMVYLPGGPWSCKQQMVHW